MDASKLEKDPNAVSDTERDGAGDVAVSDEMADTARIVDHIAERQLCRKFDFRILPVLAVMCE